MYATLTVIQTFQAFSNICISLPGFVTVVTTLRQWPSLRQMSLFHFHIYKYYFKIHFNTSMAETCSKFSDLNRMKLLCLRENL